jgi:hypothetical protein
MSRPSKNPLEKYVGPLEYQLTASAELAPRLLKAYKTPTKEAIKETLLACSEFAIISGEDRDERMPKEHNNMIVNQLDWIKAVELKLDDLRESELRKRPRSQTIAEQCLILGHNLHATPVWLDRPSILDYIAAILCDDIKWGHILALLDAIVQMENWPMLKIRPYASEDYRAELEYAGRLQIVLQSPHTILVPSTETVYRRIDYNTRTCRQLLDYVLEHELSVEQLQHVISSVNALREASQANKEWHS